MIVYDKEIKKNKRFRIAFSYNEQRKEWLVTADIQFWKNGKTRLWDCNSLILEDIEYDNSNS
mgnify:CR=1 FL=1